MEKNTCLSYLSEIFNGANCDSKVHQQKGMNLVLILASQAKEGLSVSALEEKLCVSHARVAVMLNRLEEKGLIVRRNCQEDKRITLINLSEAGSNRVKCIFNDLEESFRLIEEKIGLDNLDHFFKTFKEIKEILINKEKMDGDECEI